MRSWGWVGWAGGVVVSDGVVGVEKGWAASVEGGVGGGDVALDVEDAEGEAAVAVEACWAVSAVGGWEAVAAEDRRLEELHSEDGVYAGVG